MLVTGIHHVTAICSEATAGPAFVIDEQASHLGEALKLPIQFEKDRAQIEQSLPPVFADLSKYR